MYLSKNDQNIYKRYSDKQIENLKLKDKIFELERQVKLLTLKLENPLIK